MTTDTCPTKIPALAIALCCSLVFAVNSSASENKLLQHRVNMAMAATIGSVAGEVRAVDGNGHIHTTITAAQAILNGFEDLDQVSVLIGNKTLKARIMTEAELALITQDGSGRDFDVDVACVFGEIEGAAPMRIVGLSGDLAQWLKIKPGQQITILKQK